MLNLETPFVSLLEGRDFPRRRTTREIGKRDKQNLDCRSCQYPCILLTEQAYHCLDISVKENGNSFDFKVSCATPGMNTIAQIHVCVFIFLLNERLFPNHGYETKVELIARCQDQF